MKVGFSDAFLASQRINQKQRMQKYTCSWSWHMSDVSIKFSPLHLVSSFWLSGHLFLAMKFISEFIWVNVRWNGPTWQAKAITVVLPLIPLKRDFARARARDWNTARANQSAQDGRLSTNQHLKSADLRHRKKKKKKTEADLRLGHRPFAWAE